mgnify:CR=1 FL=1
MSEEATTNPTPMRLRAEPPRVTVVDTVGAGDTLVVLA